MKKFDLSEWIFENNFFAEHAMVMNMLKHVTKPKLNFKIYITSFH